MFHGTTMPYPKIVHKSRHDDVIKWTHFPRYCPFVRGIHRWPVNSPHKGQRRGALVFSLICDWINSWVNNRDVGDLRRYRAHYDYIVLEGAVSVFRVLRFGRRLGGFRNDFLGCLLDSSSMCYMPYRVIVDRVRKVTPSLTTGGQQACIYRPNVCFEISTCDLCPGFVVVAVYTILCDISPGL